VLAGKRDPDNGDEQQRRENKVNERCIQSAAEQPDDIKKKRQASHAAARRYYPFAKRPEYETRYLKALQAERDADDRQAQYEPAEDITDGSGQSAKNQPYKVSYKIHKLKIAKLKINPPAAHKVMSWFVTFKRLKANPY
jgi:hypothetical protein